MRLCFGINRKGPEIQWYGATPLQFSVLKSLDSINLKITFKGNLETRRSRLLNLECQLIRLSINLDIEKNLRLHNKKDWKMRISGLQIISSLNFSNMSAWLFMWKKIYEIWSTNYWALKGVLKMSDSKFRC